MTGAGRSVSCRICNICRAPDCRGPQKPRRMFVVHPMPLALSQGLVGTRDVTFMLDVHPMSWRCHICLVCAGDVSFNAADWAVLAAASGEGAVDTCSKLNRCRWSTRARLAMPFVPPFALFCWVEWRMRGPLQSQCAVRIMVPRFPAHRKHCRAMSR